MNIQLQIRKPIEDELAKFSLLFEETLTSTNETLHNVYEHLLKSKGKMMRPALLLLIAKGFGNVTRASYDTALALELLHTASLVHDDVVDESDERRGQASTNAVFGNKIAVLAGDYILSTALKHAAMTLNPDIVLSISDLGCALGEGELIQLYNTAQKDFSEERYIDIISKKTASLFMTCTKCGAISAGAKADDIAVCEEFGRLIGIAFQIKDDIFDYYDNSQIGKPTGNDMRERKLTLPALYVLNKYHDERMSSIAKSIKAGSATDEEISELVSYTKENGGIQYAEKAMGEYIAKAVQLVDIFGDKEIRDALTAYSNYIIARNH